MRAGGDVVYSFELSIYIATYNHERYIEKALDSIFLQKTHYSFEVLVGEDCSTDKTRNVLKKYEQLHKDFVRSGKLKIFYRNHNMYREIPDNADDLKSRCNGKYIIALEGDDYWIDDMKIEKQISFLESHSEYIGVSHNCIVVDENGNVTGEKYPECKRSEYSISDYMSNILPGQLTTLMYRNIYADSTINCTLLKKGLSPGDKLIVLVLLCYGDIYCMQECMSAYRHITTHGDSYSARHKYSFEEDERWYREVVLYLDAVAPSLTKYGDELYVRCIMKGIKERQCTIVKAIKSCKIVRNKFDSLWAWCVYKVHKDILHKELWL